MKKLYLLTKTLLVAAGLAVGASAWADPDMTTMTGILGASDNTSAAFSCHTKRITLAAGESYTYTFINYNKGAEGTNVYETWLAECTDGTKYMTFCSDGRSWGELATNSYTGSSAGNISSTATTFLKAYNGVTVTFTVSRSADGTTLTMSHSATTNEADGVASTTYAGTLTGTGVAANAEITFWLTNELSHQVITNVTFTSASSEVTNFTPLYERGFATAWANSDIGEGAWVATNSNGTATINAEKGLYIASTKSNSSAFSYEVTNSSQLNPTSNSTLVIDAVWNTGSAYGANNYNYLQIGSDIVIKCCGQDQKGLVVLNGNENSIANACQKNFKRDNDIWTIHIEINTATNIVTNLTIEGLQATYGSTTKHANISLADKALSSTATYKTLAMGNTQAAKGYSQDMGLISFMVSEKQSEVQYSDYTVHFVDNLGAKVKEDETRTGQVGVTVNANSTDQTTFENGGYKYVYSSDGGGVEVLASGTAEMTVTYTKVGRYNYTLNAIDDSNNVLQQLASGYVYTDDTEKSFDLPRYVLYDGTLYYQSANNVSKTVESDNQVFTVTYSATEINNVVYYAEAENINGGDAFGNNIASNKRIGRFQSAKTFTNLGLGKYKIAALVHVGNGNSGEDYQNLTFSAGATEVYKVMTEAKKNNQFFESEEFDIYESTDLKVLFTGSSSSGLDYIYVVRTGDAAISGTIASSGYSSLASGYGLDFSKATGLTAAYVVTKTTNDAVTLTSVDELPANSGVILKGTGSAAYSIPVKADAAYTGTNLLSAAVTATVVDDGAAYILKDGKFCLVEDAADEAARTIPAGKAYLLKSKVPSPARALSFMFGDEASGIDGVRSDVKSGDFYNMQGQRVASPRKGLYIVNGTKVIIK